MYYQECERLAAEQPSLAKLIEKVDEQFHTLGPSCVLRTEVFAKGLNERESQICGVFKKLEKSGLLHSEEMVECPSCQNLMPADEYKASFDDEDEFPCSQCETDLSEKDVETILIFRLQLPALVETSDSSRLDESVEKLEANLIKEELSKNFLEDVFRYTPLLRYYSRDKNLRREKPFAGKRAIVVLHFLRDLIPFMEATFSLGLNPKNTLLFYKSYPYPQQESVKEWLKEHDCIVLSLSQLETYLGQLCKESHKKIGQLIIIEDGGLCSPRIHRQFSNLIECTIGAVEQTTRGIMNMKDWLKEDSSNKLRFPILSVAGSKIKSDFEPPYIARAVENNIRRMLPNIAWQGKEIAVFGYGTIGEQLSDWLMQNGANVTVYEPSNERRIRAQQKGGINLANSVSNAAANKHFVFGASGQQSINSTAISNLSHNTYVVSASSEQYEIDLDELSRLATKQEPLLGDQGKIIGTDFTLVSDDRCIHLLANGYPINFWGMDSMPEEASDLIMSLILLASVELARGTYNNPDINDNAVNELVDQNHYNLAGKFLEIHKSGT